MLYVFQVDTGVMMTFDVRLAVDTVATLKNAITAKTDIPEDKQVLLISGGESLSNSQRVCSYSSAGTDTSPIFLFAMVNIESNQPVLAGDDYEDEADLTEMIESCMSMQPSLDTLVARTELAKDLNDLAIKQKEICERLVHDQHLQQQGWAAVTANLDDLTRAFKNKAEMLMFAFNDFTKLKPKHRELLEKFANDLKNMYDIPILLTLLEGNKLGPANTGPSARAAQPPASTSSSQSNNSSSNQDKDRPAVSSNQSSTHDETPMTLKQWINFHDDQNSLDKLIETCWRALDRLDEADVDEIKQDVQTLIKSANNTTMKEIKGLEERLFGLEKLMVDAKKVVDEQGQLASSFQSNRDRFSKIKDSTLLPDLSASHIQQLQMMLSNHKKMSDYKNRCIKAKHELSVNLHGRLKWIMYVEQQLCDLDGKLMMYKENLMRLGRYFEIVEQVHQSPELYLAAVAESLRRRRFSRKYLHWANSIAKISKELYESEMNARKSFDSKLGNHFLASLFPGLTRTYPPPFATSPPDPFDTNLPRVTTADLQYLKANVPDELIHNLMLPKDSPMPHFTMTNVAASANFDDDSQLDNEQGDLTGEDDEDMHSLNPTPPSSPNRLQQQQSQQAPPQATTDTTTTSTPQPAEPSPT